MKNRIQGRLVSRPGSEHQEAHGIPEGFVPEKPAVLEDEPILESNLLTRKLGRMEQASAQEVHSIPEVTDSKGVEVKPGRSEEEIYEEESLRQETVSLKKEKRSGIFYKVLQIVLSLGCVYLIFLIYGAGITDYQYGENGEVEPRFVTAAQIRQLKDFNTVLYHYEQARDLYEQALTLDYNLAQEYEEPLRLAADYEAMLDPISKLSVQVDALDVPTQYNQLKSMLLAWIKTDIAVYVQNVSVGISQNNAEKADHAIQDRDRMRQDFSAITQNMTAIGEAVNGADLQGIKAWSPEAFIFEELEGMKNGRQR